MMTNELFRKTVSEVADIKGIGLKDGKMAILLFLYHYSYTNPEAKEVADDLFKNIFEEFKTSFRRNYMFNSGSSGIIWAIEYLKENHFIEADTDAVFEGVDHSMRSYTASYPVPIYPDDHPFSPGLYFLKRFNSNKTILDYNRQIALIYLIDHSEWLLEFETYRKIGIEKLSGEEINTLIFFLKKVDVLNIFPYKVKRILSNLEGYINKASYTSVLDSIVLNVLVPEYLIKSNVLKYPIPELLYRASWQSLLFESPDIFSTLVNRLELTEEDVYLLFREEYDSLPLAHWAIIGLSLLKNSN